MNRKLLISGIITFASIGIVNAESNNLYRGTSSTYSNTNPTSNPISPNSTSVPNGYANPTGNSVVNPSTGLPWEVTPDANLQQTNSNGYTSNGVTQYPNPTGYPSGSPTRYTNSPTENALNNYSTTSPSHPNAAPPNGITGNTPSGYPNTINTGTGVGGTANPNGYGQINSSQGTGTVSPSGRGNGAGTAGGVGGAGTGAGVRGGGGR